MDGHKRPNNFTLFTLGPRASFLNYIYKTMRTVAAN